MYHELSYGACDRKMVTPPSVMRRKGLSALRTRMLDYQPLAGEQGLFDDKKLHSLAPVIDARTYHKQYVSGKCVRACVQHSAARAHHRLRPARTQTHVRAKDGS